MFHVLRSLFTSRSAVCLHISQLFVYNCIFCLFSNHLFTFCSKIKPNGGLDILNFSAVCLFYRSAVCLLLPNNQLSVNWDFENMNFVENRTLKMWILWKMRFQKCEFCEKQDFKNVNLVKNETLKMWILWKMRLWKCKFCVKWDFRNVNFVKNVIIERWILWKIRLWKCELSEKYVFENVNFVNNESFKMWILWKLRLLECEFCQNWEF